MEVPERVDYVDVSPHQTVSVATALIPFLEHDDANRALMGANMQRQAVPLIAPDAPLVGTGMEVQTAEDSGHVITSPVDGIVESVDAGHIVVRELDRGGEAMGEDEGPVASTNGHEPRRFTYKLRKYMRSNQGTCMNQRP